ncbi:hypothetical protein ABZ509_24495, partial [Streptomyces lavendulocolor]
SGPVPRRRAGGRPAPPPTPPWRTPLAPVRRGYRADGDERITWLAHPDGSWARATSYGGQLPLVHQSGPRRLWDVLDRIRSYWLQHGELPLRGARVKITQDGHTVLERGSWRATL